MWQHIQYYIDQQIGNIMESQYEKLNKKLDILTKQIPNDNTKQTAQTFQLRVIEKLTLHKLISIFRMNCNCFRFKIPMFIIITIFHRYAATPFTLLEYSSLQ